MNFSGTVKLSFLIIALTLMLGCVAPLDFGRQTDEERWPGGQHGLPVDTNGIPYEVTE